MYPNFQGIYYLQIRGIPETEWALFDPGLLSGQNVLISADNASVKQVATHAYIGQTNQATLIPVPDPISNITKPLQESVALGSSINSRFWRQNTLPAVGSAKNANADSVAFSSFLGTAPYGQGSSPNISTFWPAYTTWGLSYNGGAPDEQQAQNDSLGTSYSQDILLQYENLLATAPPSPAPPQSFYDIVQVFPGNPFCITNANSSYVAVMDLGTYLGQALNGLSSASAVTVYPPLPSSTNMIAAIWVTNCGTIPTTMAGQEVNLTFPPTLPVFFGDNVNTNGPVRFKAEGNFGFTPMFTNTEILTSTNYSVNPRIPIVQYFTQTNLVTSQAYIPVGFPLDAQHAFTEPSRVALVAGTGSQELYEQLIQWADAQQINFITNQSSIGYIPNASVVNYLLNDLWVFGQITGYGQCPAGTMIGTVNPIPYYETDGATNTLGSIYTNTFNIYNYVGNDQGQQTICIETNIAYYWDDSVDDTTVDPQIESDSPLFSLGDAIAMSVSTNMTSLQSTTSFSDPLITLYDSWMQCPFPSQTNRSFIRSAIIDAWYPTNTPPIPPGNGYVWLNNVLTNNAANNPQNLYNMPFAVAWMTVETNYTEYFIDGDQALTYQALGLQAGNAPSCLAIGDNETNYAVMPPVAWRDFVFDEWFQGGINEGAIPNPLLSRDTTRYDNNGVLDPSNIGGWKEISQIVTADVFTNAGSMNVVNDLDVRSGCGGMDHTQSVVYNIFDNRVVVFHYATMGWTETNVMVFTGPAPTFNGRMVAESYIQQLGSYMPTNLVINGQLTYTHRTESHLIPGYNRINDGPLINYQVNYNRTTQPVVGAERFYDVRIARVDINRVP